MQIYHWFSDGHPQKYHIAAFLFAIVALGSAATTTILANDDEIAVMPCSYSYSDWGSCQSGGKHYRVVQGYSPSGCTQVTAPSLFESCTYVASVAPQCVYTYSNWGVCQSNEKQIRSLVSKSPSGCEEYTRPVLEQHCTYTANVSVVKPSCSYSYSDWGSCQSTGKRSRTVTGYSPSGCVQTNVPYTVESCSYNSGESTTETKSTTQCVYSYSNWGTCQITGKRTRSLTSRSPSDCVEYTHPTLEQNCIYDSSAVVVSSSSVPSLSESHSETPQIETRNLTADNTTPAFSFMNIVDGMVFRGNYEIKGDVRGAESIEYYLVPVGSNTYKYIGKGSHVSETGWSLIFPSKEFPNGEFYLRVKVKNMYGEYGSGQRKIHIANQDPGATERVSSDDEFIPFEMNKAQKLVILQKMEEEFQVPKDDNPEASLGDPDQQRKHIFDFCQAQPEKCFPERDSDKDGLSDIDEIRFGTDPQAADSDLDGFIDGDEVKSGFDPVKYSPGDHSDQMVFESPKAHGSVVQNYAVQNVTMQKSDTGEQKLHLEGKGLPNSFVTIYIYSDPIVLTVKTDSEGNWTYELDKNLEDGNHEAYVAVTDNTGKITAKSEPIAFVKTAQAVTVIPSVEASETTKVLPVTQSHTERDVLLLISIITAAIAVALATIGFIKHKRSTDISGETEL